MRDIDADETRRALVNRSSGKLSGVQNPESVSVINEDIETLTRDSFTSRGRNETVTPPRSSPTWNDGNSFRVGKLVKTRPVLETAVLFHWYSDVATS